MIDMRSIRLTPEQLDDMRHALGFDPFNKRRGQHYFIYQRNYFICSDISPDWEELCELGLARKCETFEGARVVYSVTESGVDVLSFIHRVQLVKPPKEVKK